MKYMDVEENCYTTTIENLKAGEHEITAEFISNDEEYGWSKSKPINITVLKNKINLTLSGIIHPEPLDLKDGDGEQTILITPSVKGENGETLPSEDLEYLKYTLYCNDKIIDSTLNKPLAVDYTFRKEGIYTFYAVIDENDKYYSANSGNQSITIIDSRLKDTSVAITVDSGDEGYNPTSLISITSNVSDDSRALPSTEQAKINTRIRNSYGIVASEKNIISRQFDAGTYDITAEYPTTDKYKSSTATKTFNINQLSSKFTDFTISDTIISSGEHINITITLQDSQNKPISNKPVYLNITDKESSNNYEYETNNDGQVNINLQLFTVGTNTIKFTYKGNSNYKETTSNEIDIEVVDNVAILEYLTPDTVYSGWNIATKLLTGEGEPLTGQTVQYTLLQAGTSGKTYNTTTDNNGITELPINLNAGEYNFKITFDGNGIQSGTTLNKTITVKAYEEIEKHTGCITQEVNSSYQLWWVYGHSNQPSKTTCTGIAKELQDHHLTTGCLETWKGETIASKRQPATIICTNFQLNIPNDCKLLNLTLSWTYKHHPCEGSSSYGTFGSPTIWKYIRGSGKEGDSTTKGIQAPPKSNNDSGWSTNTSVTWNEDNYNYLRNLITGFGDDFGVLISFAPNTSNSNRGIMKLGYVKLKARYTPKQPTYK